MILLFAMCVFISIRILAFHSVHFSVHSSHAHCVYYVHPLYMLSYTSTALRLLAVSIHRLLFMQCLIILYKINNPLRFSIYCQQWAIAPLGWLRHLQYHTRIKTDLYFNPIPCIGWYHSIKLQGCLSLCFGPPLTETSARATNIHQIPDKLRPGALTDLPRRRQADINDSVSLATQVGLTYLDSELLM
jgi:hypothetical protein